MDQSEQYLSIGPEDDRISYRQPQSLVIQSWSDVPKVDSSYKTCRQIFSNMSVADEESFSSESSAKLDVFLRIKPDNDSTVNYKMLDPFTIQCSAPPESYTFKNVSHGIGVTLSNFTFTKVLNEQTQQKDVFNTCVANPIKSFIAGDNRLLFCYGTSSAGKTFTMQGTCQQPGIFPRSLDGLFNSIKDNISNNQCFIPYRVNEFYCLSKKEMARALSFKYFVLDLNLESYEKHPESYQSVESYTTACETIYSNQTYQEMQPNLMDSTIRSCNWPEDITFSVWISMVEIYNESIFDLLQLYDRKKRRPLVIGEDQQGATYIKDARQVCVKSGDEAFKILLFGQSNLHLAPTELNDHSSRSHCICTITLARHYNPHDQSQAILSRFSFCDLAGAERVKKTLNVGDRLTESKSINKSLLILGNCLRIIKQNQTNKNKEVVRFRESKLTHLFKNSLIGIQKLSMIVNIAKDPFLFDETFHVLKFSALAQQVIPIRKMTYPKPLKVVGKTRYSVIVSKNLAANINTIDWENAAKDEKLFCSPGREQMNRRVEELEAELEKLITEKEEIENKVRLELVTYFQGVIVQLNSNMRELRNEINQKDLKIQKYKKYIFMKRKQEEESDSSETEEPVQNNNGLRMQISELIECNKSLEGQCRRLEFELSESQRKLNVESSKCQNQKDKINELNLKIQELTKLLDEATYEHTALQDNVNYLKTENQTLSENLQDITGNYEAMKFDVENMKELYEMSQEEVKERVVELEALVREVKNKDTYAENLGNKVRELEETIELQKFELSELLEEKKEFVEEVKMSKEITYIIAEEKEYLQNRVDEFEQQLSERNVDFNKLIQEKEELQKKVMELEQQWSERDADSNKLIQEKEELQKKVMELEQQSNDSNVLIKNEELQKRIIELEKENKNMSSEKLKITKEKKEVLERAREVEGILRIIEANVKQAEEEKQILQRRFLELEAGEKDRIFKLVDQGKYQLQLRLEEAEAECKSLKADYKKLLTESGRNTNTEFEDCLKENREFKLKIDKLQQEQEKYKNNDFETLSKKFEVLQLKCENMRMMKDEAEMKATEIPELKEIIESQRREIENHTQELNSFTANRQRLFDNYEKEVRALKEENTRLRKDVQFGSELVSKLTPCKSDQKTEVTKLKSLLSDQKTEVSKLKSQISDQITEVIKLKSELSEKDKEILKLKTEGENIRTKECGNVAGVVIKVSKAQEDERRDDLDTLLDDDEDDVFVKKNKCKKENLPPKSKTKKKPKVLEIDNDKAEEFTPDRLTKEIEKLSLLNATQTASTRKKKNKDDSIHPSAKGSTRKGKTEKKMKEDDDFKVTSSTTTKKKLFDDNDFDNLEDLESSFLEPDIDSRRILRPRGNRK